MGMRRHLCMPDLADGDRNERDAGSSADNADGAAVPPRPYAHRSAASTPVPPSLYVMTRGIWTYVTLQLLGGSRDADCGGKLGSSRNLGLCMDLGDGGARPSAALVHAALYP